MTDILLRGIPDETADALSQMAQAAGQDRLSYIRELLIRAAKGPIVRSRYAYRVYTKSGAQGKITRHSDDPNGTSDTFRDFNEDEAKAIRRAADLVRRNDPGDREKAVALLQQAFEEVMEVPV